MFTNPPDNFSTVEKDALWTFWGKKCPHISWLCCMGSVHKTKTKGSIKITGCDAV